MRVYLAGPIFGRDDDECKTWRAMAKAILQFTIDPMDGGDYRRTWQDHASEIIERDKLAIDSCDVVLANCELPSFGTAMEILYAWERHKQVVVIRNNDLMGPWLLYHSNHHFNDLYSALAHLSGLERDTIKARLVAFAYGASTPIWGAPRGNPPHNEAETAGL